MPPLPSRLTLAIVFALPLACRPQAPRLEDLPRVEVAFDGFTDGKNGNAQPLPAKSPAPDASLLEPTKVEGGTEEDGVAEPAGERAAISYVTDQPDPPARLSRDVLEYELQYAQGAVSVVRVQRLGLSRAERSARRMGRFALELYVGHELLERVRFDFPLLGAGSWSAKSSRDDETFERGLRSEALVRIPYVERATRADILDRKTRRIYPLSWPPESTSPGETATQPPPQASQPAQPAGDSQQPSLVPDLSKAE